MAVSGVNVRFGVRAVKNGTFDKQYRSFQTVLMEERRTHWREWFSFEESTLFSSLIFFQRRMMVRA